ncbi:hypothetical protein [Paenibacillus sacheonensis]|uniref:Uncharacterized protein n=1 Tax=Paenibacillus sacheonensis TaxID=742054 RepID=A0A7X5C0Y6_9BACL|nr:hypothetical protein [Paenibacillus sacheonensis]MBM7565811.1 hypothetical protein [Paenibacillus sacheonensis]NBC68869.1 hypothetical protein [Paenibacillus sacheonensis]
MRFAPFAIFGKRVAAAGDRIYTHPSMTEILNDLLTQVELPNGKTITE